MTYRMVTLGTSLTWGQGLCEKDKFTNKVAKAIKAKRHEAVTVENFAHSGAVSGTSSQNSNQRAYEGEYPSDYPTINRQVMVANRRVSNSDEIDLVLLDSGVNDIGIGNLFSPFMTQKKLNYRTKIACEVNVESLLPKVLKAFPKAKVLVTGYYAPISKETDISKVFAVLSAFALSLPLPVRLPSISIYLTSLLFFNTLVTRSKIFKRDSNMYLKTAVSRTRTSTGRQVTFVESGFSDKNSILASKSGVFSLDIPLRAQDPLRDYRLGLCERYCNSCIKCEKICEMASVFHPNVLGAKIYTKSIMKKLNQLHWI